MAVTAQVSLHRSRCGRCFGVFDMSNQSMLVTAHTVPAAPSTTLYLFILNSELSTIQNSQQIENSQGKTYLGLRESKEEAWNRFCRFHEDMPQTECMLAAIEFKPRGWMYCTTKMIGIHPLLCKTVYKDGIDWGTWHFYGTMPLEIHDENASETLVSVIFHGCCGH